MKPNFTEIFKANLVKPAWADNAKETELPFVVHAIDSCILVNFQEKHKELRAKYKNFEIPEWQYSNWLKSFYKRKYK